MTEKKIIRITRASAPHWVGNGFPVNTLFSYNRHGEDISPFLLLDYAGPADFAPSHTPRGVEEHPHRGFETVTVVYQGEVEHRDNAGNAGKIGAGDVQWMTAAQGILHEEMHGRDFTRAGGTLEMIQLWVNLPAKDKMGAPHYQDILAKNIPAVTLPNGAGSLRVIAGNFEGTQGAAKTFSPVTLWDMRLNAGHRLTLPVPHGHSAMLLPLSGSLRIGDDVLGHKELAQFTHDGENVTLEALEDSKTLVMGGAPLGEPIAGYGPFVMNTKDELQKAFADYEGGRFGPSLSSV